jgi:hypothetical protein
MFTIRPFISKSRTFSAVGRPRVEAQINIGFTPDEEHSEVGL